jgi:hypothetical protein
VRDARDRQEYTGSLERWEQRNLCYPVLTLLVASRAVLMGAVPAAREFPDVFAAKNSLHHKATKRKEACDSHAKNSALEDQVLPNEAGCPHERVGPNPAQDPADEPEPFVSSGPEIPNAPRARSTLQESYELAVRGVRLGKQGEGRLWHWSLRLEIRVHGKVASVAQEEHGVMPIK